MQLKINKTKCCSCENIFFEWDDSLLEKCLHCWVSLAEDKLANVIDSQTVEVELDFITGLVGIAGSESNTRR